jgi:predicted DNA-binding transcriptional regulator AlpA
LNETAKPPWAGVPATGPLFRTTEAARYIGLSVRRYYALAARGDLPTPLKIGGRATGLPQVWLDAVIAARAAQGGIGA